MRAAMFAAALILCVASPEPRAQEASPETQAVLEVEDAYNAAELARDEATLRRILDDAFVYDRGNGRTEGKNAFVASIMRRELISQTIGMRTVFIEGDTAVVFGVKELTFGELNSPPRVSQFRYTATYQRRDGVWRMAALRTASRA